MSGPHRIRLQAAWRVNAGGAVWIRSFGKPSGIGPDTRIWLVIERPTTCAAALNGLGLPPVVGGTGTWRHDVTGVLRDRNELTLAFAAVEPARSPAERAVLPDARGGVSLEITGAADDSGLLDIGAA